jgi:hypothetical protein
MERARAHCVFAQNLGKRAPDFIVSVLGGVQGFGTDDKMWYALILERLDMTLLDLMRMNKYKQKISLSGWIMFGGCATLSSICTRVVSCGWT